MFKTELLAHSFLFGSKIRLGSITAAELLAAVESGRLIELDPPVPGSRDEPQGLVHSRRQARLLAGRGLEHPLMWVATHSDQPVSDPDGEIFSARLDQSQVHRDILGLLASRDLRHRVADLQLPVIIFAPLTKESEEEVRSWIARATPTGDEPAVTLAERFLVNCPPEVLSGFETKFSHVPARSRQVTSVLQLETGLRAAWPPVEPNRCDKDDAALFLVDFWGSLSRLRPELAHAEHADRTALRTVSLTTSALGIAVHMAAGLELLRRHSVWNPLAESELAASPLRRIVPAATSVARVKRAEDSLAAKGRPDTSHPRAEMNPRQRSMTWRLISELVEVGWQLSPAPPFDLTNGSRGLILTAGGASSPAVGSDEIDATLEAAADLYRRHQDEMDFFDIDAPWWQLGHCVTYEERSGTNRRRHAKSVAAKQWAGQLVTRLMPPKTPAT